MITSQGSAATDLRTGDSFNSKQKWPIFETPWTNISENHLKHFMNDVFCICIWKNFFTEVLYSIYFLMIVFIQHCIPVPKSVCISWVVRVTWLNYLSTIAHCRIWLSVDMEVHRHIGTNYQSASHLAIKGTKIVNEPRDVTVASPISRRRKQWRQFM